jgi:hypothetical protein
MGFSLLNLGDRRGNRINCSALLGEATGRDIVAVGETAIASSASQAKSVAEKARGSGALRSRGGAEGKKKDGEINSPLHGPGTDVEVR